MIPGLRSTWLFSHRDIRMIYFPQSHKSCNIRALHSHGQRTSGWLWTICPKLKSLPDESGTGQLLLSWEMHPARVHACSGNSAVFRWLRKCAALAASPMWPLTGKFPKHLHPAMLHTCLHRGLGDFTWVIQKAKPVKYKIFRRLTVKFQLMPDCIIVREKGICVELFWYALSLMCHSKSDQITFMVCNIQVCVSKCELERDQNVLNVSSHTRNATDDSFCGQGLLLKSTGWCVWCSGFDSFTLSLTIETKKIFMDIPLTFAEK